MTTAPVDSTTRTCCGGIGNHTQDCTATWRDYTNQLTEEQIAVVKDMATRDEGLALHAATMQAKINGLEAAFARLPLPEGATGLDWTRDGRQRFTLAERSVGDIFTCVEVTRSVDGSTSAEVIVDANNAGRGWAGLSEAEAREVAANVLAAAAELEALG
ncbi:hypothetical protein [Mycolicibacterium holsaticum]|uniref:Uncharacterized protein n=1 Tax=Mycolicibacterium holsaticum TaxID=152142 RepID=A0A1E3S3A6_9MYCO|nr:hypothetical protein [Mycolicibacterium holsaticum]ODQ96598.1 hypothetical protein BHQ17_00030 [Mycolicibacterium holsaticum]